MANKNFKARIGIEAPLIAAEDGTTAITLAGNDVTVLGDLAINSGNITTSAGTANLFNTGANTLYIGGAAETIGIGSPDAGATTTFNKNVVVSGDLTVNGTTTNINTTNLLVEDKNVTIGDVATPSDVTAAGGGITLLGATNKTITWNNSTDGWDLNQNLKVSGNIVTAATGTASLFNTNATTVNIAGAAETVSIGAPDGITTVNNSLFADSLLVGRNAVANNGLYAKGAYGEVFTDGIVADYTTGMGRISVGAADGLTIYNGGVANTALVAISTTGDLTTTGGVNSTGPIIQTTGKGIQSGDTRVWATGDLFDIARQKQLNALGYQPITGMLASNSDRVSASGARPGMIIRSYGQNTYAGVTTTAANPTMSFESSRGTLAAPLTVGAGDALATINAWSNANTSGTTPYWTNDNYTVPPAQIAVGVTATHTATATAASNFTATFPASGTTMTVTAVASGTIAPRQEIRYVSGASAFLVSNNYEIVGQLTSAAAAVASPTSTAGDLGYNKLTVTSATGIVVGQLVTGTGIPTKTYVSAINGLVITLSNFYGWPSFLTAAATGTYNFYTPGSTGTYEINATPYTSITAGVVCTGTVVSFPTNILLRSVPTGQPITSTSRVSAVTTTPELVSFAAQPTTYTGNAFTFSTWPTTVPGGAGKTLMSLAASGAAITSDNITFTGYSNPLNKLAWVAPGVGADTLNSVNLTSTGKDGNTFGVFNFTSQRFVGANYVPTQSGDVIGAYKFNGQTSSGTSPANTAAPIAQITVQATENYTTGAQGSSYTIKTNKTGTVTGVDTFLTRPENTTIQSDLFTLNDSAGVALTGNKVVYSRQYINAYSTVDQPNPVANAENLMIFGTTDINNGITIVTNGTALTRITFANAGIYNIQFSAQLSQTSGGAANTYIWLKKNGTSVANSTGDTQVAGNGDKIMAAWNYVVSAAANDYFELAWTATDTSVILDYIAAAGVVPAIPSVILTVVPVGV